MRLRSGLIGTTLGLAVLLPCAAWSAVEVLKVDVLKEEPPKNSLPRGKVVYVDDGTCPDGEIKEITGGSQEKGIPRKVRCVKRPN